MNRKIIVIALSLTTLLIFGHHSFNSKIYQMEEPTQSQPSEHYITGRPELTQLDQHQDNKREDSKDVNDNKFKIRYTSSYELNIPSEFVLILVACNLSDGPHSMSYRNVQVYLKTLALFNTEPVNLVVIMNKNFHTLEKVVSDWPMKYKKRLRITAVPVPRQNIQYEKHIGKKPRCSLETLFLKETFPHLGPVLYTDYDLIFLRPIKDLYKEFETFSPTQYMGMAGLTTWCPPGVKFKFCYNAGLVMMNLTRMRASPENFTELVLKIQKEKRLTSDQLTLNTIADKMPAIFKPLPMEWDILSLTCKIWNRLPAQAKDFKGWSIIHGVGGGFSSLPDFIYIRNIFATWNMHNSPLKLLKALDDGATRLVSNRNSDMYCPRSQTYVDWITYYPNNTLQ